MITPLDALAQIARDLRARHVPFALVGGLAVSAVALIEARGFARGQDLSAKLEGLLVAVSED